MSEETNAEEFDAKVRDAAEALVAQYGAEVENATTEKMIDVLDNGSLDDVLHWLKVRQYVRHVRGQERYVRRLSDKIIWAVEQALEQGKNQLARMLGGSYREAIADSDRPGSDRRRDD